MPDYERGAVSCCSSTWDKDNGLQHADDCPLGQAVRAMRETVIMVHVLEEGRTLCGYGDNYSNPGAWPDEHRWCHRDDFSREKIEAVNEERKQALRAHQDPGIHCFTPYVTCEKCLAKLEGSDVRTGMEVVMPDFDRIGALAAIATLDDDQLDYLIRGGIESLSDDWFSEESEPHERHVAKIHDILGPFVGYCDPHADIQNQHAEMLRQFVRDLWAVNGPPQEKRESLKEVIASLKRTLQSTVGYGGG